MDKKYNDLKVKQNNILLDNKELKKCLIRLKSKLRIREQQLMATNSAFDLSQKLTQHLKTENSLLKTNQDLIIIPIENNVNNGIIISDNEMNENSTNDNVVNDKNDNNVNNNLCKSDLIANQYETEIKEWKEEIDLLNDLDINEVVVTTNDQLLANKYFDVSEDESDHKMDIDLDENSNTCSIYTTKSTESATKLKCHFCGRKYSDESLLNEHNSRHKTDDNKIKCAENDCNFKCDSRHELKDHLKIHRNKGYKMSREKLNEFMAKIRNNSDQKRIFNCKQCNKVLSSAQSLRQHQKSAHNVITWFRCKLSGCDHKFEKGSDLRFHEQLHRTNPSQIDEHMRSLFPNSSQETNANSKPINDSPEVVSHYFTPINVNNITSDSTVSQESVPKEVKRFKCEFDGCAAEFKNKRSILRHNEKFHPLSSFLNSNKSNIQNKDSNENKPLDMNQRLQLLNLLYAEQQKHVMM